jgi:hypothetical protein
MPPVGKIFPVHRISSPGSRRLVVLRAAIAFP